MIKDLTRTTTISAAATTTTTTSCYCPSQRRLVRHERERYAKK